MWKGKSTSEQVREFLGHGTSVESGLSILRDKRIEISPGIAGHGVYSFSFPEGTTSDNYLQMMPQVWKRTATGGYNSGALFIWRRHGIVLSELNKDLPVPQGCVSGPQLQILLGMLF